MRIARLKLFTGLVLLGLLLVHPVQSTADVFLGSVVVTGPSGAPLAEGDLVGFAVTSNPGLEKTITQHLPPFTLPVVVDTGETPGPPGVLKKNLDTVLVLTDATGAGLTVEVTLRDSDGATVGSTLTVVIPASGTRFVVLSTLLP